MTTAAEPALAQALRMVLALLPADAAVSTDSVRDAVQDVYPVAQRRGLGMTEEDLLRHVEALAVISQGRGVSLVDTKGHVDWLPEARTERSWRWWERYRRYQEDTLLTPPQVVRRLDEVTDNILSKLEDPQRPGPWDRRGLVMGQVQSGKTSNYTGLVCKAADAGYRLIVVFAGIHNSLRSQTQLRLDEGFLGFDTQYQHRIEKDAETHAIGAGKLRDFERLYAGSMTTSLESGDFKATRARSLSMPVVETPVLLVVKKHAKIIRYIHDWITGVQGVVDPASGRRIVFDVPLLIIDDEADNASIDTTADGSEDPSRINQEIRRLLHAFHRSAYVGYTATPFANIYADPFTDHVEFGEDIFPKSFIEVLRAPSNYFGPERVFGLDEDEPRGAVPIHRAVEDEQEWMPAGHRKEWSPPESAYPASLRTALLDFVLSCATRRARGQFTAHNSMLVHVTRFQAVQEKVAEQVKEDLLLLRHRLRYGDAPGEPQLRDELRRHWEEEFVPTTTWFQEGGADLPTLDWDTVEGHLAASIEKMQVRTMNGHSKDALDYYDNRDTGLSVIAIGGDKLSRGLTLEGLSVSYYLRASRMYDTLMQMGRWFGYRPGYEDVCRLYTTPELRSWYREITLAANELRDELEDMASEGATPIEYGLRVKTSAAGLSVTAANKMRRAQRVKLSYSGSNPETVLFDVRDAALRSNHETLDQFIRRLDEQHGPMAPVGPGNLSWRHVPGDVIRSGFLDHYKSEAMAWRVRPDLISSYIRQCNNVGELDDWTVVLVSNKASGNTATYGAHEVGLTVRSLLPDGGTGQRQRELEEERRYAIRRVLNPPDELLDLAEGQREAAFDATLAAYERNPGTRKRPRFASGPDIRRQRRPGQGLLVLYPLDNTEWKALVSKPMVGFFLSFPYSERAKPVEYAVNPIWQHLSEQGVLTGEDDG